MAVISVLVAVCERLVLADCYELDSAVELYGMCWNECAIVVSSVVYVITVFDTPNKQYLGCLVAFPIDHSPVITHP